MTKEHFEKDMRYKNIITNNNLTQVRGHKNISPLRTPRIHKNLFSLTRRMLSFMFHHNAGIEYRNLVSTLNQH